MVFVAHSWLQCPGREVISATCSDWFGDDPCSVPRAFVVNRALAGTMCGNRRLQPVTARRHTLHITHPSSIFYLARSQYASPSLIDVRLRRFPLRSKLTSLFMCSLTSKRRRERHAPSTPGSHGLPALQEEKSEGKQDLE